MTEIKLKSDEIIVLARSGDYTLIKRFSRYTPYVVAFCYDPNSGSWAQGHYLCNLIDAVEFFKDCINEHNDEI